MTVTHTGRPRGQRSASSEIGARLGPKSLFGLLRNGRSFSAVLHSKRTGLTPSQSSRDQASCIVGACSDNSVAVCASSTPLAGVNSRIASRVRLVSSQSVDWSGPVAAPGWPSRPTGAPAWEGQHPQRRDQEAVHEFAALPPAIGLARLERPDRLSPARRQPAASENRHDPKRSWRSPRAAPVHRCGVGVFRIIVSLSRGPKDGPARSLPRARWPGTPPRPGASPGARGQSECGEADDRQLRSVTFVRQTWQASSTDADAPASVGACWRSCWCWWSRPSRANGWRGPVSDRGRCSTTDHRDGGGAADRVNRG